MREIIFILIQIILLDGILSIDNAAALAAIANELPSEKQKKNALRAGILGAYIGRGLMLLLAGIILQFGWLRLLGAAYLFYLVGSHFFHWKKWEPEFHGISSFWKTVILIEIADLAFSIDNVVAVVAITSNIWLVIIGVCISILIMRFAAQIFIRLIVWEPLLEHAAYVLIAAIATELIFKFFGLEINNLIQFGISLSILIGFIFYGQLKGGEKHE